jgi:hypothetical protein
VVALVAAAATAIALLWLPAVRDRHERAWQEAGERAAAGVRLPARFQAFRTLDDRSLSCSPRCFVAAGQPRDNVAAARGALDAVATGPVQVSCAPDGGFAVAPDRCRLVVPVDGSRLDVFLYGHLHAPKSKHGPVSAEDFQGTILQLAVAPRT